MNSIKLAEGKWNPFNYSQINKMIAEYGKENSNHNPQKPPYAVFDWDNTSIFLDAQEALLIYQLENLLFSLSPEQLNEVIRKDIPDSDFALPHQNEDGESINIDRLAKDIVMSYTWLYQNYCEMAGSKSLNEVKISFQYQDFRAKLRFLYAAIGNTFDHEVSYLWITYLLAGMNEMQVRNMAIKMMEWQLNQAIEEVVWHSPIALKGNSGIVHVSWNNGLRLIPEMQDLYAKLRQSGFDVYVCSASFVDLIKEISSNSNFGYNNPADHTIAMELERDISGVIQPQLRRGYEQTQRAGKTKNINQFLVSKYGYGPVFVAGDSVGDKNMMQDFLDTKVVLIVNRLQGGEIANLSQIAIDTYNEPNAKYLLQGRDENRGLFVKSQCSYALGSKNNRLI